MFPRLFYDAALATLGRMRHPSPEASSNALASLYPHFTAEQLAEAEARLDEYLEVVLRIADRIAGDPVLQREFSVLTEGE